MQPDIASTIVEAVKMLIRTTSYVDLNRPTFYTCPILKDLVLSKHEYSQESINEYDLTMHILKGLYIKQINKELKVDAIHKRSDAFITHQVAFTGKTYGEARTQWLTFIISCLTIEESACLIQ